MSDVSPKYELEGLIISLENPQNYLDRATSWQKKYFTENAKLAGSPWVVSLELLKISPDELLTICQQSLNRYKG